MPEYHDYTPCDADGIEIPLRYGRPGEYGSPTLTGNHVTWGFWMRQRDRLVHAKREAEERRVVAQEWQKAIDTMKADTVENKLLAQGAQKVIDAARSQAEAALGRIATLQADLSGARDAVRAAREELAAVRRQAYAAAEAGKEREAAWREYDRDARERMLLARDGVVALLRACDAPNEACGCTAQAQAFVLAEQAQRELRAAILEVMT